MTAFGSSLVDTRSADRTPTREEAGDMRPEDTGRRIFAVIERSAT